MATINDHKKKTFGMVNGYGGRCEIKRDGTFEDTKECAVREVYEELGGKIIKTDDLKKVGHIINGEKIVDIFVVLSDQMFDVSEIKSNNEMSLHLWYREADLRDINLVPKTEKVIEYILKMLEGEKGYLNEFIIDKTNDAEIQKLKIGDR